MDKQKTLWFKGGLIGAIICVTIFAVYFVSIPLLSWQSNARLDRLIMTTGHAYVLSLGFIIHPADYCGSLGALCTSSLGWLIFLTAVAALIATYMLIGAFIGRLVELGIQKKKQKRV